MTWCSYDLDREHKEVCEIIRRSARARNESEDEVEAWVNRERDHYRLVAKPCALRRIENWVYYGSMTLDE
jgi:hypothetical protein